jgi:hypothetical protein
MRFVIGEIDKSTCVSYFLTVVMKVKATFMARWLYGCNDAGLRLIRMDETLNLD